VSAVLLCRVAGPVELLAVMRPVAGSPDGHPVLVVATGMPRRVVMTATARTLNAAEHAALAGQLGIDPQEGDERP